MLFSSLPQDDLTLILDIQSSVVRGTLVRMRPGIAPQMLLTASALVPYKPTAGSGYLIKTTLRALGEAIDMLARELHSQAPGSLFHGVSPRVTSVHYVLSSPWIISQAKTLSLSFPKETEITQSRLSQVIAEERAKLDANEDNELVAIEEKVFDVRLNGYSVAEWEGKRTQSVDVSFVLSLASKRMIQRFIESCRALVPSRKVFFHSSLLLQNIGMRRILPGQASYTLIHAHGEITDIVIVRHGSCVFFGSYPMGVQTVVRKIAHATKTDERTAESALTLYTGKQLDPAHTKPLTQAIGDISTGWAAEFTKLVKRSASTEHLPKDVFISARSHDEFFAQAYISDHPAAHVKVLSFEDIEPHVSYGSRAERLRILGLCAIAIHSMARQ